MGLHAVGVGPAMIHHVRVGEALDRVLAVAHGEHSRRRHEAKRRQSGEHYRHTEANPGPERREHLIPVREPTA